MQAIRGIPFNVIVSYPVDRPYAWKLYIFITNQTGERSKRRFLRVRIRYLLLVVH